MLDRSNISRPRGSALLTVMWLSAGLSAIALSVASTVRNETDRVSTAAEGLRAFYLASGALERAIQWTQWGTTYRRPGGAPMFFSFTERRYSMDFPSGAAVVEAIPEASKLDINTAGPEDLYRVAFAVSGDETRSRQIAEAIVDWRSPAPGPTAFDQFYLSVRPTFRGRHASFQEIEELLLVRGMSPELFYGNYVADASGRLFARGGLRDCLSVWGSLGPFDASTASPALMEAMGTPPEAVRAIVARRQFYPIQTMEELNTIASLAPRLAIGRGYTIWTLRATARVRRPDGSFSDTVRTAAATVKLVMPPQAGGPIDVRILRWYDDAWSQDIVAPGAGMPAPGGNIWRVPLQ